MNHQARLYKTHSIIIFLFVSFILNGYSQNVLVYWNNFKNSHGGAKVQIQWDPITKLPRSIKNLEFAPPNLIGLVSPQQSDFVSAFFGMLSTHNFLFNVDTTALVEVRVEEVRNRWLMSFEQQYNNIPIFKSRIGGVIAFTDSLKITSYYSNYHPDINISLTPQLTISEVADSARKQFAPQVQPQLSPLQEILLIYPDLMPGDTSYTYKLAWKFLMQAQFPDPEVDKYFIIDAQNGEILVSYPAFVSEAIAGRVEGEIFPENPGDLPTIKSMRNALVNKAGASIETTNTLGQFNFPPSSATHSLITTFLRGPFADVSNHGFPPTPFVLNQNCNISTPCDILWAHNPGTLIDTTDAINVFYHLNLLHDEYYQAILGFDWKFLDTGSEIFKATVNHSMNNAKAGNPIWFGTDNYARSSDVIYHEATHCVLFERFNGWIGLGSGPTSEYTEGYAMDEGFSDFFACAFTNDSRHGEGYGGTRDLQNTVKYPLPYNMYGHDGGEIIGGSAWELRQNLDLNVDEVDNLIFDALELLADKPRDFYFSNPGESNFFTSLLETDDMNNNLLDGTPHDMEIFEAFRRHDLLPYDLFCRDSESDVGNVPSSFIYWRSPDIIVDAPPFQPTGGELVHESIQPGVINRIYVTVRNLGYLPTPKCFVKLYYAPSTTFFTSPGYWNYIDQVPIINLPTIETSPQGQRVMFEWRPDVVPTTNYSLMARVVSSVDIITEPNSIRNENNCALKRENIFNTRVSPFGEFYIYPLPFGSDMRRDFLIEIIEYNSESSLRFVIPHEVHIRGKFDPKRIQSIYDKKTKSELNSLLDKEIIISADDKELVLPDITFENKQLIRMQLVDPEKLGEKNNIKIRIMERHNGSVVGGMDYNIIYE